MSVRIDSPQELFLDPGYMGMKRSGDAVITTVLFTAERPLADKRLLTKTICKNVVDALGICADDLFIALIPVPTENFSFGRGAAARAGQLSRVPGASCAPNDLELAVESQS